MVWFKVDDKLHDHPKVRRLGKDKLPALGLWTTCGSWSGANTSDGFIPREIVLRHDPRERVAGRLVEVGLWSKTTVDGEPGYQFHQWSEYQPTRASIEAEQEKWRTRKARQRGKSPGESRGTSSGTHGGSPNGSHADVRYPTRPDPYMGHPGEGQSPPARAHDEPPPPRCPKHTNEPAAGPCGPCADARRLVDEWHAEQDRVRRELTRELGEARRNGALRCEHGTDGGLHIRSDTGQPLCAMCRAEQTAKAPA